MAASQKKNVHYQKTEDGRMVFFDENRKVVNTQKMSKRNATLVAQGKKPIDWAGVTRYCWRNNKNGVPLFVHIEDTNVDDFPDDYELFPKTEATMLTVLQLVADGKTLRSIGHIPGCPPLSVIMRWSSKDEDFREALNDARKSRAEVYHDAIEHVAFNTKESTAKSSKVKIDALKFLATVNDRDRFGNPKVADGGGLSVSFTVNTGIAEKPIKVEGTTIDIEDTKTADGDRDGVQAEALPAGDPPEPQTV